jgi:sugar phosphate isomerase/epimerase
MRTTIASYSFHGLRQAGMMDVFGYLESVRRRYHLHSADIWNGTIGDNPDVYLEDSFLQKIKASLAEQELSLANYHVDGVHVWEADPAARERNYQNALRHLEAAEELGARTVRIDAGGRGTEMTDEQFDLTVRRYAEYARFGQDAGFRVGPENHWGPSLNPDVMERIARAVGSPAYGVLLHIGHWDVGEEADGDRRIAPYAMHTHIDARVTEKCLAERIQLLVDAGYKGYWGIEHHSAVNEYAEVAYQLAAVQRALVKLGQRASSDGTINPLLGF